MSPQKVCPLCGGSPRSDELFCPRDGSAFRVVGNTEGMLAGQVIADRYHVLRLLGKGGMGQVYLAEHVKMGRRVALKVISPNMAGDADTVRRFIREAENASKVSHSNVAAVYDFGETHDGLLFLAMEFVDGPPLTNIIEHYGTLPPGRAAEIIRQAAEALMAAHDLNIVHRDLKPDNILIARTRDGSDFVKIVDFGLAKAWDFDRVKQKKKEASQDVTKSGSIVGTPDYMSPEQVSGGKIDGRSDIYSLGLVTYKILTGTLPFAGASDRESLIQRLTVEPPRLAVAAPSTSWTASMQLVMDRVLAAEPQQRYQTARDFARDLVAGTHEMSAATGGGAFSAHAFDTSAGPTVVPQSRTVPQESVSLGATEIPTVLITRERVARKKRRLIVGALLFVVIGAPAAWLIRSNISPKQDPGSVRTESSTVVPGGREGTPAGDPKDKTGVGGTGEKLDGGRGGTKKRDSSVTKTPTGLTSGSRDLPVSFSFPATKVAVRLEKIASPLRERIESALNAVPGAEVATGTQSVALVVAESSGVAIVRRRADEATLARMDSASIARRLVPIVRRELAIAELAAIEPHARGALQFQIANGKRVFALKDTIQIHVRSAGGGYLTLVDIDPAGAATILHPGSIPEVGRLNPGQDLNFNSEIIAGEPIGEGVVRAIVTSKPLDLSGVVLSPDGTVVATKIRQAIEKIIRSGGTQFSTVAINYVIKAGDQRTKR